MFKENYLFIREKKKQKNVKTKMQKNVKIKNKNAKKWGSILRRPSRIRLLFAFYLAAICVIIFVGLAIVY
jgi:hypothetical protein